jgi:hypothetical protein
MNASMMSIGVGVLVFVASVLVSLALVALVLVRLPPDYFVGEEPPSLFRASRPAWQKTAGHIGKNILGVALILLGVVLSLPGVPGQGILTILIGMTLIDFRGKRRLEQRIMRHPAVRDGANRIRARFGKEPLELPEAPAPA